MFTQAFKQACSSQAPQRSGAAAMPPQATGASPVLKEINERTWRRDYAFHSYCSDTGSWNTRGVPQPGMIAYETECRDIKRVFSYQKGENEETDWIMSGELEDGSVFYFQGSCDYTGFDCQGGGKMILAPRWDNLLDHLADAELRNIARNISKKNPSTLIQNLNETMGDTEALRSKLKEVLVTR